MGCVAKVPAAPVMRTCTSFKPRSSDISKVDVAVVRCVGRSVSRKKMFLGAVASYSATVLQFDCFAVSGRVIKKMVDGGWYSR